MHEGKNSTFDFDQTQPDPQNADSRESPRFQDSQTEPYLHIIITKLKYNNQMKIIIDLINDHILYNLI